MNTLDYIYRYYKLSPADKLPRVLLGIRTRRGLLDLFNSLEFKLGVEVGVWNGRLARFMCYMMRGAHIYGVDPWKEYTQISGLIISQETQDENYKKAVARLANYNHDIIRESSMDAVKQFMDGELDFVYIDANHAYEYVKPDATEWAKKVRPGGIVSGHDFDFPGVEKAVREHTEENGIVPWFILDGDRSPSWFYVKE